MFNLRVCTCIHHLYWTGKRLLRLLIVNVANVATSFAQHEKTKFELQKYCSEKLIVVLYGSRTPPLSYICNFFIYLRCKVFFSIEIAHLGFTPKVLSKKNRKCPASHFNKELMFVTWYWVLHVEKLWNYELIKNNIL